MNDLDKLDKELKRMLFQDCKNKVDEFNEICNYVSQYSHANIFIIPVKYVETIKKELDNLIGNAHIPLVYEFQETDEKETMTLTLFNFGVMQREQLLKDLGKCPKE